MDLEADAPICPPGPIPDPNTPLPWATDILLSPPLVRSPSPGSEARTRNPVNINYNNIKWHLKETKTVAFATMVKMFLVRNRLNISTRADIDGLTNHVPALMEEANAEYRVLLQQAIDFCNLDIGASSPDKQRICKYVKKQIRAFCNAKVEADRYLPIVNTLNAILSLDNERDVIFIRNHPMFVESSQLPTHVMKRKPDIVLVTLASCKNWLDVEEPATFQRCRERAGEGTVKGKVKWGKEQVKAEVKKQEKRCWTPIEQFWAVKMSKKLNGLQKILRTPFDMNSLAPSASGPLAEVHDSLAPESSSMGAKRTHSDNLENPSPTKRARANSIGPGERIMPPPILIPEVDDDDVQCAYYAIELLRVSWKASHASGILLKDELLEALWYDPEGCIRTTPINIVEQLPLLMVLVQAQRRSGYLSGLRDTPVPGNFDPINNTTPCFRLVGRMTSCGRLKASSTAPSTSTQTSGDGEATHFFKSSWAEDIRPREGDILATAETRVSTLLPERYRPFVLDHLPTVFASREIYDSSTAIIRALLGLSTGGSRTQYLMCSNLLSNLLGIVPDFELFKGILYDIVRAHRLLWVIGISHGDVSFHNIMVKPGTTVGVLNDFDLATVMNPGGTSPPKIGLHHTGTPWFMAVDLLGDEAMRADIPRLYRHDLESFAWILLYASICIQDGKETLDVKPIRDWTLLSSSRLQEKKICFLMTPGDIMNLHNKKWLLPTFRIWYQINYILEDGRVLPQDAKLLEEVLQAWKIAKEDWVDFTVA